MSNPKHAKMIRACISIPTQLIDSSTLDKLLVIPPKKPPKIHLDFLPKPLKLCFFSLLAFGLLGILRLAIDIDTTFPFSSHPCSISLPLVETQDLKSHLAIDSSSSALISDAKSNEHEFWRRPDGLGYKPCLNFSEQYLNSSEQIVNGRSKYLMVVVSGGMNQQRNQIVDAVVIARILGASLVVPILQVNVIWGDESEFTDVFDLDHFKRVLEKDVRVVSSLPSTHLMSRPLEEKHMPFNMSPRWIRTHYLKKLQREGVLLLRGFDSRLSKDLPPDLQKLRCKVQFHALRFNPRIQEMGDRFAERMRKKGPYLALHLRMEKDVWVRTGCFPGLTPQLDQVVIKERNLRPELLTGKSNLTFEQRKQAGLCPLNAVEVVRLLKALGAPRDTNIYWAGGQPLGGEEALRPLTNAFSQFYSKKDLAMEGEMEPFLTRASFLAAIDFVVSEKSDVFMASHGGNMGHAIQGRRAYAGHKKHIIPNKREMLPYFLNSSLTESEFNHLINELHGESMGQPELRTNKAGRDVTKYPVPECMCSAVRRPSTS